MRSSLIYLLYSNVHNVNVFHCKAYGRYTVSFSNLGGTYLSYSMYLS